MAKKLFVGNLSFDLTQDQFKNMFAAYGTVVSANIVIDKFSGRSKGFGFVEFENDEEAMKAMAELNNSEQMGRNIAVKEAIIRPEAPVVEQPMAAPAVEEPVTEVSEPVAEVSEPVTEVSEPVAEVSEPVAEVSEPVAEVPSTEEPAEPEEPAI